MNRSVRKRPAATALAVSLALGASCLQSDAAEKNPLRLVSGVRTERLMEAVPSRVSASAGDLASTLAALFPPFPSGTGRGVASVVPTPRPVPDGDDLLRTALVDIGRNGTPFDYVLKDGTGSRFPVSEDAVATVASIVLPPPAVLLEDELDHLVEPMPSPFVERFPRDPASAGKQAAAPSDAGPLLVEDPSMLAALVAPDLRSAPDGTGHAHALLPDPERFGSSSTTMLPAYRLFTAAPGGKSARLRTVRTG